MPSSTQGDPEVIDRRWWVERLGLMAFVMVVYEQYFPLSHYTVTLEGNDVAWALDRITPLSPSWVYVYVLVFIASFVPAFVVVRRRLFRRVAVAYFAVEVVALVTFVVFPVHMTLRAEGLPVDSFATWGIRLCYWVDIPTNCFPSLHVAMSTLAALCCWKSDRLVAAIATVVAVLIGASTMLVKQHYFADVVFGFALASASYLSFVHPARLGPEPRHFGRWAPGILVAIYVVGVGVLYVAYRAGWAPWTA